MRRCTGKRLHIECARGLTGSPGRAEPECETANRPTGFPELAGVDGDHLGTLTAAGDDALAAVQRRTRV